MASVSGSLRSLPSRRRGTLRRRSLGAVPRVETLEPRVLLSALIAGVSQASLQLVLTAGDSLTVVQTAPGEFDVTSQGVTQHYAGITSIQAIGSPGNDAFFFIGVTVPMAVDGGAGDDLIDASACAGPLTATGGPGNDVLRGGRGNDMLQGDAGNDRLSGGPGKDILLGDSGQIAYTGNAVSLIQSTATAIGGNDYLEGNAGADVLIGGAGSDELHGDAGDPAALDAAADGNDILLGDNGLLNWLYQGSAALASGIESGFVFDTNPGTLDLITTIAPKDGGNDTLYGDAGSDVLFGGTGSDLLVGDNAATGVASARPGADLMFGDYGRLYPQQSYLQLYYGIDFPSRNFFSIDTGFTSGGAADVMFGNAGDDIMIGGQGDDQMFGGAGDDDMIGGHNVAGGIDELQKVANTNVNDFLDGGAGNDVIAGDNATIWRNSTIPKPNDLRYRFRALAGSRLYNADGTPGVMLDAHDDPRVATTRSVVLLDHAIAIQVFDGLSTTGARWGNDLIAGNAGDDALFGELGNDLVQGDGAIDPVTLGFQVFEGVTPAGVVTDGDDYIEGNGGADLLIGGLGQDDLIGGSSQLFGLTSRSQRPDVSDTIFGGAMTPGRIQRGAFTGDQFGDQITFGTGLADRHSLDADFILGDNGDVYRVVDNASAFLQFTYDQPSAYEDRGSRRIVVRACDLLDYSTIEISTSSIGTADVIHGESGDDVIYGESANDVLYGDAEDDQLFGGRGSDWLSGGTGQDALLGDNGLIMPSRNGLPEPLYGLAATSPQLITEPDDFLAYLLNPAGQLKYTVDLEPFGDGGDDVLYGGLGDDALHGGAGNDALSGAEALPEFYNNPASTPRLIVADLPEDHSSELRIVPIDGNGQTITGFYDRANALPKLANFFLNFENDLALQAALGSHYDPNAGDGRDVLFGDWGNDWLVGGTGRDHLYGGMGNDILNLDDDLETDGGTNNQPDLGHLIPGPPGSAAQVYDNADFGYGGGGRDLLIVNTGADRAEDWVGQHDNFVAPFTLLEGDHVHRDTLPHSQAFYYLLSAADGADPTRIGTAVPGYADPARNGEPFGELGLIIRSDTTRHFTWAEQTGGPIDRQPGTLANGVYDTRGDSLSGGSTNSTATTTATVVVDIAPLQSLRLALGSWAASLSGFQGLTVPLTLSADPVLAGDSLLDASVLQTTRLPANEFRWVLVPL